VVVDALEGGATQSVLQGRVALITGGASGIGRAVAELFAAQGADVVVLDRAGGAAAEVAGAPVVLGDVRDPAANHNAVQEALRRHGALDIFVGNAGIHDGGMGVRGIDGGALQRLATEVLGINVVGYMLGAHAAAPALRERKGCMIFTLSDASFVVGVNHAGLAYAASKHAGVGVVRALAAELAPNVRVNGVAPGGVPTALRNATAASTHGDPLGDPHITDARALEDAISRSAPLKLVLTAEQVAHAYLYLAASPAARGMTGEVIRLDGGLGVR